MKRALMFIAISVASLHGLSRQASADKLTLYSDVVTYQNALASLGLVEEVIDFETLPDGTPVGAGDVLRSSPEAFGLFGVSCRPTADIEKIEKRGRVGRKRKTIKC